MSAKKDPRLERAGVSGYNKPKRTPNHPTKSHIVVAKEGDQIKTIRFGQQVSAVLARNLRLKQRKNVELALRLVTQRTSLKARCLPHTGPIGRSGNGKAT